MVLFFISLWCPHSTAIAVKAKNSPPDCFLYAFTVLKEIIFVILAFYSLCKFARAVLFYQILFRPFIFLEISI